MPLIAFIQQNLRPPSQTISPVGIASAEAFGTPSIALVVFPAGIASAEAFGTVSVELAVAPAGIASEEAFGTPVITAGAVIMPAGIASEEAFGDPTVTRRRRPTRNATMGFGSTMGGGGGIDWTPREMRSQYLDFLEDRASERRHVRLGRSSPRRGRIPFRSYQRAAPRAAEPSRARPRRRRPRSRERERQNRQRRRQMRQVTAPVRTLAPRAMGAITNPARTPSWLERLGAASIPMAAGFVGTKAVTRVASAMTPSKDVVVGVSVVTTAAIWYFSGKSKRLKKHQVALTVGSALATADTIRTSYFF